MELKILLLIILISLSGFFSGSEVALLSVTPIRVRTYLKEKRKGSGALSRLKARPRRMIITILIGNNVVNITAASLVAVIATDYFGSISLGIAAAALTLIILIFGEITPKTLASQYAGRISLFIARPIEVFGYLLYPLVIFLDWLAGALERFVKFKKHALITEADIKTMVEFGVEHRVVEPAEQYIINRALAFSDITAHKIMIPLWDVFSLESSATIDDSLGKIIESGFSRIPLFERNRDTIIGIAMVKDMARELVANRGHKLLKEVAVPATFVPENIRIDYLFKIFQKRRKHMAIVQDKDKKAVGIVTLEDLVEELVGEIVDESDVTSGNDKK
jgi:CBS domain containing-hemolysin-like protein